MAINFSKLMKQKGGPPALGGAPPPVSPTGGPDLSALMAGGAPPGVGAAPVARPPKRKPKRGGGKQGY